MSSHTPFREMATGSTPSPGQLLRRYRALAGLTQEQLAERCGYSADYLSKLERGQRQLPSSAIDRLAQVLGLDLPTQDRLRAAMHAARAATDRPGPAALPERQVADDRPDLTRSLPRQLTSFVGREREVETLSALLRSQDIRLLTLTGPGGIGKTRLALRLAESLQDAFADGVYFVPLAALRDPQHVGAAVASTLGVAEAAGVSLADAVVAYLGRKQVLLLLDNFEHVQPAAAFVRMLVERCLGLRLLVTSRAALQLSSERRFEVLPLATPGPEQGDDVAAIGRHAAVKLFVDRAQAVREDFRLDRATARDLAAICSTLDGLPLAIELAAARVRLFPPRALLQRLSPRLTLLSSGPPDRPPRHQTLRATIDWSFDLLSSNERLLFARVSAFAGGCTFEAIEQVCNPDGELNIMDLLTSLVDKSLIRRDDHQEARFWLLETVREYAAERLLESGERDRIRQQHATYFASMLRDVEPLLVGSHQFETLANLDLEVDNVRAALACLLDVGRVEEELLMASALFWFWDARGRCSEARRWLEEGLNAGVELPSTIRGHALLALGKVAFEQGDLERASYALEESLAILRALNDQAGVGRALNRLGAVAWRQGDYERAVARDEEGLRIATSAGDPGERAHALVNLAIVATHRGDHATARERLTEAVGLNRAIGDRNAVIHALINLGYDRTLDGDLEEATAIFEEVLDTGQRFGLKKHVAYALENLGNISVLRGEHELAATRLHRSLVLGRELSDQHLLLYILSDLAKLDAARGACARAARLDGAVRSLRTRLGVSMAPAEDEGRDLALERARASLGEHAYARAHAEGTTMTLDEVLGYALGES